MPFIPHTETEIAAMLDAIGVDTVEDLFDEIPAGLRARDIDGVPEGLSEMAVARLMAERARNCDLPRCFTGAGAYEHHIPAAVWEVATRGEFYSAYTPYQAEASQGTLQLIYEYQSMMAQLTGLDASNASLYDGASALAEAVLMAVRANRNSRSKRILMPRTVHPAYRKVVQTIVANQGFELVDLPFCTEGGNIIPDSLHRYDDLDCAALVVQHPNFFGVLEDVDQLTDWAHHHKMLVIGLANPISLALIKPPGHWGQTGADIACGEGQPLGIPLSSGGPYFGYMCCRMEHVRQMPGRIVGRTVDLDGKPGFTLTLQAREQHIRRSKATSNICTNQGLMVTAATQYLALLGAEGLRRVAAASHNNTRALLDRLTAMDGVSRVFSRPCFHEAAVRIEGIGAHELLARMVDRNILGGFSLKDDYPELGESLLFCVTETKSAQDIEDYAQTFEQVMRQK